VLASCQHGNESEFHKRQEIPVPVRMPSENNILTFHVDIVQVIFFPDPVFLLSIQRSNV
jgi:hypothetical protein